MSLRRIWDKLLQSRGLTTPAEASNPGGATTYHARTGGIPYFGTQRLLRGEPISVKDFGAVGDGVTDDAAAIQSGLDFIDAAGGGELFFPSGNYLTTETLYLKGDNVCMRGVGRASQITCTKSGGAIISLVSNVHSSPYPWKSYCRVQAFYLYSTSTTYGIDCTGFSYSLFDDLLIQILGSNKACIYGVGNQGSAPYYNVFSNLTLAGNNDGAGVSGSSGFLFAEGAFTGGSNGPNANIINNIHRALSLDFVFDIKAGNGNLISNVSAESIHHTYIRINQRAADFTGTATSGGSYVIADTGASWPNFVGNAVIKITGGTGAGQVRHIYSNTATTITLDSEWTTNPDNTSVYAIYRSKAHSNIFSLIRGEGSAGSNPDFIRAELGALWNRASDYETQSLGSGEMVRNELSGMYNRLYTGDLIHLNFVSTGIPAAGTTKLTPAVGGAYFHGGIVVRRFIVEGVFIGCEGRTAGLATITVSFGAAMTLTATLDADHPYRTCVFDHNNQVPVAASDILANVSVAVTTDGSWAPTTADVSVSVLVRVLEP